MKTIKQTTLKSGVTRLTIEVQPGEKIISVRPGSHYELGYPHNDVVPAHVIEDTAEVCWCSLTQKWEKA
jgi:hypothetical protein